MKISDALLLDAKRIAEHRERETATLKSQLSKIEKQKEELEKQNLAIKSKLHTASVAAKRQLNFVPTLGPNYHCPRCWIDYEIRSGMEPVSSPSHDFDIMRCRECGHETQVLHDR